MRKGTFVVAFVFFFVLVARSSTVSPGPALPIPVTADLPRNSQTGADLLFGDALPSLSEFAAVVKNGQASALVGVYAPLRFAYQVMQQPPNDPAFVVSLPDTVTQFSLANQYATVGLLAHNYLSGASFPGIPVGQEIDLIYGDGSVRRYATSAIRHLQALRPNDPYSAFVDLDANNAKLSSTDLFKQVYMGNPKVVFQTCISADGNPAWGRLFVIAAPMAGAADTYFPTPPVSSAFPVNDRDLEY